MQALQTILVTSIGLWLASIFAEIISLKFKAKKLGLSREEFIHEKREAFIGSLGILYSTWIPVLFVFFAVI